MFKILGSSILIQSFGTLASFLTVWIITNKFGISSQGQFAITKSWVDLVIVIGCFGFPQSFIYVINKHNTSKHLLKLFSLKYASFLALPIGIATYFFFKKSNLSITLDIVGISFLTLAIALLILHSLLRGIYLTENSPYTFSLISALPALILLFTILINLVTKETLYLNFSYFISGLLSCIFVLSYLKTINDGDDIPWKITLSNGNNVFLQSLAITFLPICTYWLMEQNKITLDAIGGFNISVYFYQAFALPLNMIAPIFFNKWSQRSMSKTSSNEVSMLLKTSLPIFILTIIVAYFIPNIIRIAFGTNLEFIYRSAQILLLAATPFFIGKVLSAYLSALGYFSVLTKMYLFKTILCIVIMLALSLLNLFSLINIAISWVISDIVLMVGLLIFHYRLKR